MLTEFEEQIVEILVRHGYPEQHAVDNALAVMRGRVDFAVAEEPPPNTDVTYTGARLDLDELDRILTEQRAKGEDNGPTIAR